MSSAIKTPAFQAKASNILNEDNSSIYSGGEWSFKNASAVTGFHVDADGNVGVGTANPAQKLHVNGNVRTNSGFLSTANGITTVLAADANGSYLETVGANNQRFFTNGAERMRLDASGNVGIGTTSPSTFTGYTTVSVNNATNGGIYNILVNGTETARLQAFSGLFNIAAKGASTQLAFEVNGAERMRLDASGNCIVTTTNANYITAGGTGGFVIQDANVGGRGLITLRASSGAFQGLQFSNLSGTQTGFAFLSSSTSQVGYVSDAGAWTFGSSGSVISHTIQAPSNLANTAAVHIRKQNVAINSGGNSYLEFYGASGGYDGYLGVSGTTLQVVDASDSRKKENVRPANYGLKEIKELKPVVYDWKEEFGGEKNVKGFLAQEVKQVLPECVTTRDETDAGGFEDAHYLGTANMIPVLVAAIQELSAKVDAQAAEIEALKAK